MADIARLDQSRTDLTAFDPYKAKAVIETLDAAVALACRMQRWDEGMEAAELMVRMAARFRGLVGC